MSFFSGRSEPEPHETRRAATDPYSQIVLNGKSYRVVLHVAERLLKVRLDTRDATKLNAKAGDTVRVGDPSSEAWTVRCVVPTQGGAWLWLER